MPKLGYIGLKIRYDSRGHSGPACVQTPFLLLKLFKNYLDLINNTRLGETSAEPNLPLTLARFFIVHSWRRLFGIRLLYSSLVSLFLLSGPAFLRSGYFFCLFFRLGSGDLKSTTCVQHGFVDSPQVSLGPHRCHRPSVHVVISGQGLSVSCRVGAFVPFDHLIKMFCLLHAHGIQVLWTPLPKCTRRLAFWKMLASC